ncbi:hypothetical protein D3C84_992550 [compost metagenome]
MGHGQTRAFDLTLFGVTAQLLSQFVALGQAGGPQRMPFGEQATRRVDDDLPAVGVVSVFDELFRAAFRAKTQGLVTDHLVLGEAVV